jgi:hypothetical protein
MRPATLSNGQLAGRNESAQLITMIVRIHADKLRVYGARKMWWELHHQDHPDQQDHELLLPY